MNPVIKKAVAGVAIKKGIEKVQDIRAPKRRSFFDRIRPILLVALGGGVLYYLAKSGKLQPIVERVSGGGDEDIYSTGARTEELVGATRS